MIVIRFFVCAAIACGMAFAGGQQFSASDPVQQFVIPQTPPSPLPAPMASAIQRLANPGAVPPSLPGPVPKWFAIPPGANLPKIRIAQAPMLLQKQCSIPLAEYKIPNNPKFAIRELPLPKHAPDSMPVMKAPVCPAQ